MLRSTGSAGVAALATLLVTGCVGDTLDGGATAALIGGADSELRSVVTIGPGLCGATLVAPNLLLTAKHCVARLFPGPFECNQAGEVVQVDPTGQVTYPDAGKYGPTTAAESILVGPIVSPYAPHVVAVLVTPGAVICEDDAALLILDRPVDNPVLAPLRLDDSPAIGESLVAVGYGATLDADFSSTLQERDVLVEAVGPAAEIPDVASAVSAGFFTTGEATCRGDSGSPALSTSGAVVGVASSVSRIDLDAPTGTSSDCVSPLARSTFQSLDAIRDFLLEGLAAAGATPWLDGEPDPRAGLEDFGAACTTDDECRSNACVDDGEGIRFCTRGCLYDACPEGHACELVEDRMRCLPGSEPDAGSEPDGGQGPGADDGDGGCGCRTGADPGSALLLVGVMVLGLRRRRASDSCRVGAGPIS